jgi:hypothetical protein
MRRIVLAFFLALALVLPMLGGIRPASAQGQVYTDSMDSAESGLLSTETFDPTISFTYLNGEFVVDVQQPSYTGDIISTLFVPELASSRLTVDTRLGGDPNNKYVIAGCRHTDAGEGYFFGYLPATGDVLIWRRDASGDTNIAQSVEPSLIAAPGSVVQIGIDCWTNIMTGIVNGQPVLSAFDDTYATGRPSIGVGANGRQTDGLKVAFDNLTVTDNGNLELGPETPTPGTRPSSAEMTTERATELPAALATEQSTVESAGQSTAMRDPAVDPEGALSDAFLVSLETTPLVADLGGTIDAESGSTYLLPAGVELVDFYAELYFVTPDLPAGGTYLVGFCFWVDADGNCYDIYLEDTNGGQMSWAYGYSPANGPYQMIQSGEMPAGSVDPTPGQSNFLSLTVYQGTAILSGNSFAVDAVIPLQGTPLAGDIKSEVEFIYGIGGTTLTLETSHFSVWDLSSGAVPAVEDTTTVATEPAAVALPTTASAVATGPTLPPLLGSSAIDVVFDRTRATALGYPALVSALSGNFTQESDVYAFAPADVTLADFYTVVSFTNPADVSTPFDVGIGFRADQGPDSGLRLTVSADGTWYLQQPGQDAIASGAAMGWNPNPGAVNTIELLAQGPTGIAAVNGVVLPQLDLSLAPARGDIYVGAGFFQGDTVAGRMIPYSQWWIYPTSVLDVPSG